MPTFSFYNHTVKKFLNGDWQDDHTYKVILLDDNAVFDGTDTTLTEITNAGAYEVYGNGWAQGGVELANVAISTIDTDDALFDADDVSEVITGGDLGPIYSYVVFDDTLADDPPLCHIALDVEVTVLENNAAVIEWSTNGIIRANVA